MAVQGASVNVSMSVSDYEYIRRLTNIRKITATELGKVNQAYDNFEKKSGAALTKSNKNFNTFSGQLGYQTQDLIVQLQGGQNALLAIGQQGSQLLSVLNPMYGLFLVLGTTAASFAASLFTTGKGSEEAKTQLDRLTKTTKEWTVAQKAAFAVLNAQAIEEANSALSKTEDRVKSLTAQISLASGGSAPASSEYIQGLQDQLTLELELRENAAAEVKRLESVKKDAQYIGSQAYIQELRDQAEENKASLDKQLLDQQAYQTSLNAINQRAIQEEFKARNNGTLDEFQQL
ncbi:hypothetical protein VII00023_17919, partial [Vibrio ichthyoenteri ATCC 700023]